MRTAELVLDGEPDAVPRARAFAAGLLEHEPAERAADAELVVTELVTNAILHGAAPITLRVQPRDGRVRVEVEDAGRSLPVKGLRRLDAMTGRGLELVTALTVAWGVEPCPGGKVVWAEVGDGKPVDPDADPFADVEALLAAWDDEPQVEERHAVRLGAVPTELLLAAKSHTDNVVRELTLVRAEEASSGVLLPPEMAALVRSATEDFADARQEIKRQALDAAHRGEPTVELTLHLPVRAADAGERYLAALEEADRHARAARLLTLAPPRSHLAFRRWYVQALVDQLRAVARGDTPTPPPPFPQVLAEEVDRLSSLEDSWQRLQVLQRITAALTDAGSLEEVASTVVQNAARYPGVLTSRVYVLEERSLRSLAWSGTSPQADRYAVVPLSSELPGAVVARTGQPLFLRSATQIGERFPSLSGFYADDRSLHVVPLALDTEVLGVLAVTFAGGEVDDDAQVSFVRSMADVLAQAVERAQANARVAAERARERQLLSAQLEVLTGIVAGRPLGDALTSLLRAVESVSPHGMLASVLLADEEGRRLLHGAAPSLPDFYNEAIDGIEIGPSVGSCGTCAYRREQVVVEDIGTDPLWADYRDLAERAGLRACWSTPIIGRTGTLLGTFGLYYPQPQRPGPGDQALIEVLVRTVAMAVERSRADEERERALAAERAAALTLQHSLLPAVPARIGPVQLASRYRTGDPGVEVGGDWFDAVPVEGGALLVVGDVQGHDLRAAAVMGQLRTVARASAGAGEGPAGVLHALDRYLEVLGSDLLTTALVVRLDAVSGRATLASAGHLPPVLLTESGQGWLASDVDVDPGPPLGLGGPHPERDVDLPDDAVLLLYTDGLVENRAWPLDHGLELLRKELESQPPDADLASFVDAALELVPTGSRGDDVALLGAVTARHRP